MCKHICRVCGCTIWSVLSDDGYSLARVLQCSSGLLMCGHTQIHTIYLLHTHTHKAGVFTTTAKVFPKIDESKCSYTKDLIAFVKFPAEVCWPSSQDEGNEDTLSILTSNNVESQTCGTSVDQNPTRFSETMKRGQLELLIINYTPFLC